GHPPHTDHRARYRQPLGIVLGEGLAVLFLAPHPRAALRPRLCRGTRGRASARDESRPSLLEARARSGWTPSRSPELAARPWRIAGSLRREELRYKEGDTGAFR